MLVEAGVFTDVFVEELFLVTLDVFRCIGPVLELLGCCCIGSILSADLALATMPVLIEPDFT